MTRAAQRSRLLALLNPLVRAAGYDLEGVEVTPAGRRRVLRVVVDADGGVSLDAAAELSRAISAALDGSDVMGAAPYALEVSSPGVDRPLTEPRHWRRATGRLVRARRAGGGEVAGRLRAADDDGVDIDAGDRAVRLGYDELARGQVDVELGPKKERR
jgi:ribosome maturation factor RimP